MLKTTLSFAALLTMWLSLAQTQIKLMTYNLLHYPTGTNLDRKDDLRYILDTYEPDIFMVTELESETGSDEILNYCLNDDGANYSAATFRYNGSSNYLELQQMLYYNHQKFELIYETALTTSVRDINHYVLKLLSQESNTDPVIIDVYVAHLKASSGANNENIRLNMVNVFTNDLQNISQDHFVVFAGDFNLYSSNEPAYQELLDASNYIVMKDPVNRPGSWHNNSSFTDLHTQSTHSNSSNDYVGGGIDDRFDFILLSENTFNNPKLQYIPNTYLSYGNNGNCFNHAITHSQCNSNEYDLTLRQHLYNMSDHLPVVLTLETNQILSVPEMLNQNYFSLNANFIQQVLTVKSSENLIIDLKIINISGQTVFSRNNYRVNSPLNVSVLENGVYFLNLTDDKTHQIIKFVKGS
jgi:endonuclease/exonuclease/phosphatase family metal-dependent hydrolase